jgi:hypothetical protein
MVVGKKMLGDIGKAQFYFAFKATKGTQKKTLRMATMLGMSLRDIRGTKMINCF